ncbi:hypothetical protein [Christiangramia crocea]|uniref:Uncharacterized protein n=1 Tax=Christiangramia crocea TaxID=2904124 RepID=A0A9X1UVA0_9FLAO|nr:hypothetical protein [Gramella crocea]MCG9970791.1 hypothetical protein [Gramella crocea]
MDLKPYIALYFIFVFFGKFVVMDSKILLAVMDGDEIAYNNPFCEKHKRKVPAVAFMDTMESDSEGFDLTIESLCNNPLTFELFNWNYKNIKVKSREYAYYTPSLQESVPDRFYPPPKMYSAG